MIETKENLKAGAAGSLKTELDRLAEKYETKDFIKDDPVQFVHIFKDKRDIELAGFLAALFAFGKREVFIKKLNALFNLMEMKPYEFAANFDSEKILDGFNYRFIKECDIAAFLFAYRKLITKDKMSLEELFNEGYKKTGDIFGCFQFVCDYFYENALKDGKVCDYPGYKFMLSNPKNKGAMKRMNMFLRWMIRKNSPVDVGIWNFLAPSELFIPLDVHVGNISRSLGLLNRKQNDSKSVFELTRKLKEFNPIDPVKYDFALFGYGVNNKNG